MPGVPRIVRELPRGTKHVAEVGFPKLARIRWHHGVEDVVRVVLVAWTENAAEVRWRPPGEAEDRTDWIPIADVGRGDQSPGEVEMPPHTVAGRPRQRW